MELGGIQGGVAGAISNLFDIGQDMQATVASVATGTQAGDGNVNSAAAPISTDNAGLGGNVDITA